MIAKERYDRYQRLARLYGSMSMLFLTLSKNIIPTEKEIEVFKNNYKEVNRIIKEINDANIEALNR